LFYNVNARVNSSRLSNIIVHKYLQRECSFYFTSSGTTRYCHSENRNRISCSSETKKST